MDPLGLRQILFSCLLAFSCQLHSEPDLQLSGHPGLDINPGVSEDNITFQNVPFEFSFYVSNLSTELAQKNVLRVVTPVGFSIIGAAVPVIDSGGLLDSDRRYNQPLSVDEQCKQYSGWMECHLRDLPRSRGYGIYFDGVPNTSGPLSIKATITSVIGGKLPATDTYDIPLFIIDQNDIVELGVSIDDETQPGKIAVGDSDIAHIKITNSHPANTAHATVLQIPIHRSVKLEYIDGCLETSHTDATIEDTDDTYNCNAP